MRKLYQYFCRVEQSVAMAALVATTTLIFVSSVMRYFDRPLNWALEISMFIFAWCVFLSADVAFRENRMVNLDLVTNMLPVRMQLWLSVLCNLIILVFLAATVVYGFDLTWRTRVRMFHGIDFSYAWVTLSLPMAAIFMSVTACIKLRELMNKLFPSMKKTQPEEAEKIAELHAGQEAL